MKTEHASNWTIEQTSETTTPPAFLHSRPASGARAIFRTVIAALLLTTAAAAGESSRNTVEDLFDMSIEQLMEEEITETATLTQTSARIAPAAITTITREQIQTSGARSLFELLDIYVPNLQWWRNTWEPDNLGLRGIMSDRDDKYLLLVNGRVMNERTHYGAISERDMVLLRDIHHINIIRGPGSALYGPGAVSMVIDIVTENAGTFEGTEVSSRMGVIEEFYTAEFKHGRRFKEGDGGIFLYAGVGRYPGASEVHAPLIHAFDFPMDANLPWDPEDLGPDLPGEGTRAGDPLIGASIPNDGAAARGLPPIKLHAGVQKGNWDIWARYTRGGKQFVWDTGMMVHHPYGWGNWMELPLSHNSYNYQQITGYAGYNRQLTERTALDAAVSYDIFDYVRVVSGWYNEAYREDKYHGKVLLKHNISDRHRVAGGFELSHHELGLTNMGWPHLGETRNDQFRDLGGMPRWFSNMYSVLGEHQWTISDSLTSFIGARLDNHSYTDPMFSPRAALVHTPTQKDTLKLMWAQSVRANFEERLKVDHMLDNKVEPEKLDSVEMRYERSHNKNFDLAASVFVHYDLELIAYSSSVQGSVLAGRQRNWGFELEALYHTEKTRLAFSHGFTKMYDFTLYDPDNAYNLITAQPYGFGDDLARWSNHVTKVNARYKLDDQWTLDGSLRIYWGFPGLEDYANDYLLFIEEAARTSPGWKRSYRGNYYLNLGLQYQHNENLTMVLNGYNLLGIFDRDLNKRNYGSSATYRSHAPALGLSLIHTF